MPYEVQEPTVDLHEENKFYFGVLKSIEPDEESQYGPQLKWKIVIDGETWEEDGVEKDRETWTWCSMKLTTHPKNKFRKYAKGLLGHEPTVGELFDEQHYTLDYYAENPDADPVQLTGRKEPWRVAVMFEHYKKNDGTDGDKIILLTSEEQVRGE